jgi:putative glycosyltransferase (TIGR04372 family)
MKPLRRAVLWVAQILLLIYVLPAFAVGALRALWRIRDAEIVALCHSGFGHTLTFPDCLRRTFKGRRIAAVYLAERGRYNPLVDDLFADCAVVLVMARCAVPVLRYRVVAPYLWWVLRVFYPLMRWWLTRKPGREVYMLPAEWHGLLPAPELALMGGDHLKLPGNQHPINAIPRYFVQRQLVAAPPAQLPEALARPVAAALERLGPARRTCCLYLRHNKSPEPENRNRNGGAVADHLPAVEWLAAHGYRVLLTGDLALAPDVARRFGGMFVDHAVAGVDRQLFSLYAATRSDIWIGTDGGAALLPVVADLPMLAINWFPYYVVFPHMTMFYKYMVRPDGELVAPHELFGRFAFDWSCEGYELRSNTPEQIRAAVIDFVQRIEAGNEPGESPRLLGKTPEDVWFNIVPAWVSTPWLKPFEAMLQKAE